METIVDGPHVHQLVLCLAMITPQATHFELRSGRRLDVVITSVTRSNVTRLAFLVAGELPDGSLVELHYNAETRTGELLPTSVIAASVIAAERQSGIVSFN